jgi:hypothetical protein
MKIYIVVDNDRHIDTQVHPFTNKDDAIKKAMSITRYERNNYFENLNCDNEDEMIFYCIYSSEGDHVIVFEKEIK